MMHTAKYMHQILDLALPAYDELFQDIDISGLVENKGIIYLALINYPNIYPFLQADGYHTEKGYPAKKCNQCNGSIDLVRQLSVTNKRNCRDCKDIFEIETVSWSTHSFTVIDDELVRDRYFYQCPSHYGPQDQSMMFV